MGTIRNGANGGFKGKAGSVIGSSWKSIDYIKGLYKKRTKPATLEQQVQQAKFALLMRFLMPAVPFLRVGFGQKNASTQTASNVAFASNSKTAIVGTYPDLELDYAQIKLSDGSYHTGGAVTAEVSAGALSVTWDATESKLYNSKVDDQVYLLLYQPQADEFVTAPDLPLRGDGGIEITLPSHLLGGQGHLWIFLADRTGKKVSKTSYLGVFDLE